MNYTKRFKISKRKWFEIGYNDWANKRIDCYKLIDGIMFTAFRFKIIIKYKH